MYAIIKTSLLLLVNSVQKHKKHLQIANQPHYHQQTFPFVSEIYLIRIAWADAAEIPRAACTVDSGTTWTVIMALARMYHFPKSCTVDAFPLETR